MNSTHVQWVFGLIINSLYQLSLCFAPHWPASCRFQSLWSTSHQSPQWSGSLRDTRPSSCPPELTAPVHITHWMLEVVSFSFVQPNSVGLKVPYSIIKKINLTWLEYFYLMLLYTSTRLILWKTISYFVLHYINRTSLPNSY